ncbi:Predicted metal-dependent hydrolase, TIM-barrel fold [Colwellia chukchiensis]|uniref:Predicted metal-dependent hydrolase, TIM-barrel fold n=1 Tax=Colwellia chukchiensis TaxID=641665 RepID=A0A1H7GWQ1_9GAMM|nr:amidohydrolase family protein [Colwellia chukchiensis]SEK42488.1 Predicted metal-dependent hydrolase, TIM-barrel fold [Colwellia chukchiensis]
MKIIDPHLHLFDLALGDYQWLKADQAPFWPDKHRIAKNFTEQDLTLTPPLTLAGFVHIEAGFDNQQPWREIAWLENHCQLPFRSIAMLDISLASAHFNQQLTKLMAFESVVGIRHILDEHALAILCNPNSQANLTTLAAHKLIFELQMPLTDTPALAQFMSILAKIPELKVCVNHAGWPVTDSKQHQLWFKNLTRLAEFTQVFIKCSGFEMFDRDYLAAWQRQIVRQCLAAFTVKRVMLASNFPLNILHSSYQNTWQNNTELLCSTTQRELVCFANAVSFYQLALT